MAARPFSLVQAQEYMYKRGGGLSLASASAAVRVVWQSTQLSGRTIRQPATTAFGAAVWFIC